MSGFWIYTADKNKSLNNSGSKRKERNTRINENNKEKFVRGMLENIVMEPQITVEVEFHMVGKI